MRIALCVAISLLLFGCGDDDGGGGPSPDAAADVAADALGDDGPRDTGVAACEAGTIECGQFCCAAGDYCCPPAGPLAETCAPTSLDCP